MGHVRQLTFVYNLYYVLKKKMYYSFNHINPENLEKCLMQANKKKKQ